MYYLRHPYIQKLIVLYSIWLILSTTYYYMVIRQRGEKPATTLQYDISRCRIHTMEPEPEILTDSGFKYTLHGNIRCPWEGSAPQFYCPDTFRVDFIAIKSYLDTHDDKQLKIVGNYELAETKSTGTKDLPLKDLGYRRAENLRQYLFDSLEFDSRRILIASRQIDSMDLAVYQGMVCNAYDLSIEDYRPEDDIEEKRLLSFVQPIYFKEDESSMIVSDSLKKYLTDIVNFVKDKNSFILTITGNTNDNGNDEYNMVLGLNRAKFVKDQIKSFGIIRADCLSKGEREPKYDNRTQEGYKKNRRVDLQLIKSR